jgi:23S rRNA (uracil1939-C5)-methyltransferase
LQHVSDDAYADYLVDRVAGALRAQGLPTADITSPHLSPPHSRRRATVHAERIGKRIVLGFAEMRSHRLVDVRQCPVLLPQLAALLPDLRVLLDILMPRRGRCDVQLCDTDQGVSVLLVGVEALGLAAHDALMDFAARHQLARLAIDDGSGAEDRYVPNPVTVTLSGMTVPLPHAAFLQATDDGERALVSAVCGTVGTAQHVADLFAGLGTFSSGVLQASMPQARTVYAAEGWRDAALALRLAANRAGLPIECEHRDLFRRPLTPGELARFDAVVIDPPRAGAEEQARHLAASTVPTIAYVSCNPNTFARDAAVLIAGGYRLLTIRPVGQFRWSTHVELAAHFAR